MDHQQYHQQQQLYVLHFLFFLALQSFFLHYPMHHQRLIGMLPFVFSALSMNAVGRAAMAMIEEVRRQFRDIPALRAALDVMIKYDSDMSKASSADRKIFDKADGIAEYEKCVEISTTASIK